MERRPTMPDVAREAGVSAMTVSYVYNKPDRVAADTRTKVLKAADRLGYPGPDAAARNLRRGRTGNIGVVLGERLTYAFSDPQATAFLAGIAEVCAVHELGLTLIPATGDERDAERVRRAAVDGLILWTTTEDDPVLAAVRASGLPAAIQGGPHVPGIHLVSIDDRAAAAAVGRVALRGARRPAVLSFPFDRSRRSHVVWGPEPESVPYPVTRTRLAGYRDAVDHAGLNWDDVPVLVLSRNDRDLARAATHELPAETDALLAMSDELALGALAAPHRSGPDRLAVAGWDDSAAAAAHGLTTVTQSLHEQGARCARLVVGPEPTWRVTARRTTRSAT
jgi:DNA-binding LacI/PurR family transcriptional regulator